jgi:hypothetical protein
MMRFVFPLCGQWYREKFLKDSGILGERILLDVAMDPISFRKERMGLCSLDRNSKGEKDA